MRKTGEPSARTAPRLLLVDDNRNGLLARKLVLEQNGYDVSASSSPEEALKLFASETFDLVVTDYRMPGMNGTELILQVRALRAGVPVVLVSGMVEVLGLTEQNTGADAVVAKTATELPNMLRAVNRLLKPKAAGRKPATRQTGARSRKKLASG